MSRTLYGKGDTYRKVDQQQWSANYDRIFGSKNKGKETEKQRILKNAGIVPVDPMAGRDDKKGDRD